MTNHGLGSVFHQGVQSDLSHLLQLQQAQTLFGHIPTMGHAYATQRYINPGLASLRSQVNPLSANTTFFHPETLHAVRGQRLLSMPLNNNQNSMERMSQTYLQNDMSLATSQNPSSRTYLAAATNDTASATAIGIGPSLGCQRDTTSRVCNRLPSLPALLAQPGDHLKLSAHQVFLRQQIESFRAGDDEISTHTRGRNKPICMGQVGIRCRHCAHIPIARRQKGSTYFPSSLQGIYQASQNMSTTHMQCGLCDHMPDEIKNEFARLLATKVSSSGAGRPYWAESAENLGLIDTEEGIRFVHDLQAKSKDDNRDHAK